MTQPPDSLRLLGAFQLRSSGREVTLGQARLEELTTLIAVQAREPISAPKSPTNSGPIPARSRHAPTYVICSTISGGLGRT